MKQAAAELHVTPGAISQQIASLEDKLNCPLFIRSPRALTLTPQGQSYLQAISPAFRRIAAATEQLTQQRAQRAITLSCTSGFATQWLLPRLPRFEQRCPGIELRINTSHRLVDLLTEDVQFAVRHGAGRYPELTAERLLDDELIPVCSPALLARPLTSPQQLLDYPLLHDEHRQDWALWLKEVGVEAATPAGAVFTGSNGVIEAAKAGAGIALVRESLVERELAAGQLASPLRHRLRSPLAYYLVYHAAALLSDVNRRFRDWMMAEAGQ